MSRLGKMPVEIPSGVQASVEHGIVSIQGPKGKLELKIGQGVTVAVNDGQIVVDRSGNGKQARSNHGTTRSILANMVTGVTEGWKKSLILSGVGYNARLEGQTLLLNVGLSYEARVELPKEISCKVKKTDIELESVDNQLLGNYAAKIRKIRPPEPYLGKGIRLSDETVRRKAGKAGK